MQSGLFFAVHRSGVPRKYLATVQLDDSTHTKLHEANMVMSIAPENVPDRYNYDFLSADLLVPDKVVPNHLRNLPRHK